jgi:hypothetical protein
MACGLFLCQVNQETRTVLHCVVKSLGLAQAVTCRHIEHCLAQAVTCRHIEHCLAQAVTCRHIEHCLAQDVTCRHT